MGVGGWSPSGFTLQVMLFIVVEGLFHESCGVYSSYYPLYGAVLPCVGLLEVW